MLEQILIDQWFTKSEAKVYLATLELGNVPASTIARRLKENRITVYSILKLLVKKWFIKESSKNKTKYFFALDPQKLLKIQQEKVSKLKESLPEFMNLISNVGNKPKISYYEWVDSLKALYMEILEEISELTDQDIIYSFTWDTEIHPEFEKFLQRDFVKLRKALPVRSKVILASKYNWRYADFSKTTHECVVVESSYFGSASEVVLYSHEKVGIFLYNKTDVAAIMIQSKTLYDFLLGIFHTLRHIYRK